MPTVNAPANVASTSPDLPMKRTVLILSAFFPPWGGVGALRMTKLVKYLPLFGWHSRVLASAERSLELRDDTQLADIPATVTVTRVAGPLRWLGGRSANAAAAWRAGRTRRLLGFAKALTRAVVVPDRWVGWSLRVGGLHSDSVGRADVVLSSGPPHSSHFAGIRIARRIGAPFVMDMRDDWLGNPMHRSPVPWHSFVERVMERWCISRADRIVVVSDAAATRMRKRYPGVAPRILAVPNGFDPDDLPDVVASADADRSGFLFAGTLRHGQHVGVFFEAFGQFAQSTPAPVKLTMLGLVDRAIQELAEEAIPARALEFRPPVDHRTAVASMASAGCLIVFTGGGGGAEATMTGKLYEYLAVRRPILLVGPPGPAAELVTSTRAGVSVLPQDCEEILAGLEAVSRLAMDPQFTGASDAVLEQFDRRQLARRWAEILDVLTRERPSGVSIS